MKEAKNGRDSRSSIIRVVCSYLPSQMQVDLVECHKAKLKPGALDIAGSEIGRRGISAHIHCSSKLPTYIAHPTLINLKSKVIDTIGK